MTETQLRTDILTICRESGLEDLDPEIFDIFPDSYRRIGTFFILDGCLYHGETSGSPRYWPIGKCEDIKRVLYRLYKEDGSLDFCFEFSDMLFVLTHNEYRSCTPHLICGEEHIDNETAILSLLRQRAEA